ncbi:hypothetical protein PSOS111911_00990 [Pseudoalteromonas ostreae]
MENPALYLVTGLHQRKYFIDINSIVNYFTDGLTFYIWLGLFVK